MGSYDHSGLEDPTDVLIPHVPYPLLSYFLWLYVWVGCQCLQYNVDPGTAGFSFPLLLRSLWCVKMIGYILTRRSYSCVCILHHLIITELSESTLTLLVSCILSSLFLRLSLFPPLFMQCMGLCVIYSRIPLFMIVRIVSLYFLIVIELEIWFFTYCVR